MTENFEKTQAHESTEVRKRQIIAAARKLIVKYGSEHLTIRRMAREIGITEAAIYRHFKSKTDILSLLADSLANSLLDDIRQESTDGENTLAILERATYYQVSPVKLKGGTIFPVIAEIISYGDKNLNRKIYNYLTEYIAYIRDLLSRGIEEGVIKEDIDIESTALLLFAMVQSLANIWTLSHSNFALEKTYRSTWNILHTSIAKN